MRAMLVGSSNGWSNGMAAARTAGLPSRARRYRWCRLAAGGARRFPGLPAGGNSPQPAERVATLAAIHFGETADRGARAYSQCLLQSTGMSTQRPRWQSAPAARGTSGHACGLVVAGGNG